MSKLTFLLLTAFACSEGDPQEPAAEEAAQVTASGVADAPNAEGPAAEPATDAPVAETEDGAAEAEEAEPAADASDEPVTEASAEEGEAVAEPDAAAPAEDQGADEEPAAEATEDGVAEASGEAAAEETAPEEPPAIGVKTYALTPSGSSVYVQVFKDPDTVGAALSHDHVIAARGWSGQATWDPDDPSKCAVRFTLAVNKLDVDPPKLRAAVGLEGELSSGQREEVKGNMLDEDQLNGAAHPEITFVSSGCEASGSKVNVTGTLTVRGKGKQLTVPMTVSADGQSFSASGSFRAKATDFGFEPFSAGFGALKNKNSMKFVLNIKGSAE